MNARLLALAALAAAVSLAASLSPSTGNVHGNTYGNPKAPILIEVFSDFQCPGCKAFHDNDFPKILSEYVASGKVYVIYRYYPLPQHPYARACAEYACAASRVNRYKEVSDALFAQQSTIEALGNVQAVVEKVLTPTEAKAVEPLLKSPEVARQIEADIAEGKALPVKSTPYLLVTAHGKSQPLAWYTDMNYTLFQKYLDDLLAK